MYKEVVLITKDRSYNLNKIKEYSIKRYNKIDEDIRNNANIILIESSIANRELIENIKLQGKTCNKSIIVIVGKEETSLKKYIDFGISDYIQEPFSEEELYIRLKIQFELLEAKNKAKEEKLKFNVLLDNIPYMTWMKDKESNYQVVNREFVEHSGKESEDIRGKGDIHVWDKKIGDKCREYDLQVMNQRRMVVFDEVIPGHKGYKEFNVHKSPIIDENDNVVGTMGIARDITELKNREAQFKLLIENIPFRVWLNDSEGNYINANSKFAQSIDSNVEDLIGKNIRDFYSEEEITEIIQEDKNVMNIKKAIKFEKIIIEESREKIVEVYKTPVFNIANEVVGIVGTLIDVTEITKAKAKIRKQANTDTLTQIPNRRALYEYIDEEAKPNDNLTVMFIDVDNFKIINDTYGHNFADIILVDLANTLTQTCSDEFVCRVGGDEFIIIFKKNNDKKYIIDKANEILKNISKTKKYKNRNYNIYISIGIADCCYNGNMDSLLMKGDLALYKAKETGKNKFEFYTEELEKERNEKLDIINELKKAVERDEINLFYQPQYNRDNKLIGFEALFRWKNKKYGNIPIIEIIKIMEKGSLIIEVGNEILRKACLFAKKINENRLEKIVVSINISVSQIIQENFVEVVKNIVEDTKVDKNCIAIEITETVFLENINKNISKLKKIRDMGIEIALDDFGTGYSSFNYLVELPLSMVKIDQKFVRGIDMGEEYIKLIKLIIDSSHSLNLTIVGEGVETKQQFDRLKDMDIDYVQGYLFSKPVEEKEALKLIDNCSKI
ncbi:EAL domain-containing protein [Romboutsia sp.]|uniref:EAL domain-containing protein n=1 Tax=Romboutsia sp. TaxID=1965302 RepID=UPI003F3BF342